MKTEKERLYCFRHDQINETLRAHKMTPPFEIDLSLCRDAPVS